MAGLGGKELSIGLFSRVERITAGNGSCWRRARPGSKGCFIHERDCLVGGASRELNGLAGISKRLETGIITARPGDRDRPLRIGMKIGSGRDRFENPRKENPAQNERSALGILQLKPPTDQAHI
jgi:hypothetical protein